MRSIGIRRYRGLNNTTTHRNVHTTSSSSRNMPPTPTHAPLSSPTNTNTTSTPYVSQSVRNMPPRPSPPRHSHQRSLSQDRILSPTSTSKSIPPLASPKTNPIINPKMHSLSRSEITLTNCKLGCGGLIDTAVGQLLQLRNGRVYVERMELCSCYPSVGLWCVGCGSDH